MEPHREEQKPLERPSSEKQKRFRIVKLEERIAPSKGGNGGNSHGNGCNKTLWCTFGCTGGYSIE